MPRGSASFALALAACNPPPDRSAHQRATTTVDDANARRLAEQTQTLAVATPGQAAEAVPLTILNEEALAARVQAQAALLGHDRLFEDVHGRPVPWLSPQVAVAGEPDLDDALLLSLRGSSGLGGPEAAIAGPRLNGNALGLFEPILEPPNGGALARFHTALRELALGRDPDGKVRVLLYGASHTEADVYPHYLRTYLQDRFGNGGHGFVHIAKPWRWYGHIEMEVEGFDRWRTEHAQRAEARPDGYYGLLGASLATTSKRAFGRVRPRGDCVGSRYEIYFLTQPKGGSFKVLADGEPVATVKTRGKTPATGVHAFALPEGAHTIEVQPVGNGEVRLFGMTVERDQPGIVVDTLGIGGTRAANLLAWDQATWSEQVARRDPALVVLAYGTNEANDADQSIGAYASRLRDVVERIQVAAPQASCLLVGPGDFPLQVAEGRFAPRARLRDIVRVQAEIAAEMGCGFWDTLAFMGGELSMVQWASAEPRMAKDDHIHFTRRGYVRMGMALTDALMVDYDEDDPLLADAK